MKLFFLILFFLTLSNCSKPKTVLICGDHICINKSEAKQYFEENLSIEVKIIDKKNKKEFDLVELNLNKNTKDKKEINILPKKNTKKKLKTLSDKEIIKIKENIKIKRKNDQIVKKITKNKDAKKKDTIKKEIFKNKKISKNTDVKPKNVYKKKDNVYDVCKILEKCSIDEISKFLIEQGRKKDFPDITAR